jgi:hypothetical protein
MLLSAPLFAQEPNLYKSKPAGHEKNKQLVISAFEADLKRHTNDSNFLVLPGLVADKQQQRIEVIVESTGLGENAPCEFTIVGENSEHAYETLLISFAQPSAISQALQFIGKKPGEPIDPEALRYWARGERFQLSLAKDGEPPVHLEKLLLDRRTEKTLPEEGFRFTGSKWLADATHPGKKLFAADALQPMAIVSLFNSTYSLLEVPYAAPQGDVYQNTSVNPEHRFSEGELLKLIIEPVKKENAKGFKDLALKVSARTNSNTNFLVGLERLKNLNFQLKDGPTLLNEQPSISSVMQALGLCDRKRNEYYLTVSFSDDVTLGEAQALVSILAIMDSDRGMRIEPPPPGQLHYRAFNPDKDLLDRDKRVFHPWELFLSEKDGAVSGELFSFHSVFTNDSSRAKLESTERMVSNSQTLLKELAALDQQARASGQRAGPSVIMVLAPSTLKYGQLVKFLELVLPTHKVIHIYLDETMPPLSERKS